MPYPGNTHLTRETEDYAYQPFYHAPTVYTAPVSCPEPQTPVGSDSPRMLGTGLVSPVKLNTGNLDLPSIAQVPARSSSSKLSPYHNLVLHQFNVDEKLPSLHLSQQSLPYASSSSSPQFSPISSASSAYAGSQSSYTTIASSKGPKTPGSLSPRVSRGVPGLDVGIYIHNQQGMNQGHHEMYYASHMSPGTAPPPQTLPSHYGHQQPPLLQPGPTQYQNPYPSPYGYAGTLTSPSTGPPISSMVAASGVLPHPSVGSAQGMGGTHFQGGFDTTGQIAPPGMKPRVTATLWEDEGSLCFQVESRGICVARREDNHMINGTKLLNVAGMTRGRRDGILKSEKVRHVVKIGPMHLKGVWIPFERALDFANKEKITELLYPLFVHNIGALLYHPSNQTRTSQVMAAAERRKIEQQQNQLRGGPHSGGLPSLQNHSSLGGSQGPLPPQASTMSRPNLEGANTFPTPPTSASSVMGSMGSSDFQWGHQQMANGQPTHHPPMTIDTNLSNARSVPTTPATTPPSGSSLHNLQHTYPAASQSYDGSRSIYSAPSSQASQYASIHSAGQERPLSYQASFMKSEMPSMASRSSGSDQQSDVKSANGIMSAQRATDPALTGSAEDDAEPDHDQEYTHDSNAYDNSRSSYNYSTSSVSAMPNEHMASDIGGSPHHSASGRATPRSAAASQTFYSQQDFSTPPRGPTASSNLYSVMSSDRAATNSTNPNDVYSSQNNMTHSIANGYTAVMNGSSGGVKRSRDDDDDRPTSVGPGMDMTIKRRKTGMLEGSMPSPTYGSPVTQSGSLVGTQRRR